DVVADSICHSLDDLNAVVDPLQEAGVERPMAMSQDPFKAFLEVTGESLQRLDSASNGAAVPLLPEPHSSPFIAVIPKVLQIILQNVHGSQPLIGREQLVESDAVSSLLDVLAVPQQEPTRAFDNLAGWFVLPESIGLIDTDTVDHLSAVLGDDVEQ